MILCKVSFESSKILLNDGAKFYRKYKLCLHISTVERSANKKLKMKFYKLQLIKRCLIKIYGHKKNSEKWDFFVFQRGTFCKKNYLKIFNMVVTRPSERSTAIFDVIA